MPRPNRYHPYNHNNRASSPRCAAAPSLAQVLHPMPAITEQPLAHRPYQHIPPGYIRGVTQDGKALAVKSAYQTPDGMLHVQMQVVRFPSEDIKLYSAAQLSAIPSPPMMQQSDPAFSDLGIRRGQTPHKGSESEASSQDGRSIRGTSEECAISTDDEDAEGEEEEEINDGQWRAIMEQRRIMADLVAQRTAMRLGQ